MRPFSEGVLYAGKQTRIHKVVSFVTNSKTSYKCTECLLSTRIHTYPDGLYICRFKFYEVFGSHF